MLLLLRFFPVNEKEMDRSGNAKAGTVVDTDIVHPCFDDYYLLSHAGLLGTSKPVRTSRL
jgi:eukaryotic translation initiation factor 2C